MAETVEVLVEGGKATGGQPLGPALGPLGVNIPQIVAEINKKTKAFEGMKVPVKIYDRLEDKGFRYKGRNATNILLGIQGAGYREGVKVPLRLTR